MLHNNNASNQENRFSIFKKFISSFPLILTCVYALLGLFSFFKYSGMNVFNLYLLTTFIYGVCGAGCAAARVQKQPGQAVAIHVIGVVVMLASYVYYKPLPAQVVGLGAAFGVGLGLLGAVKLLADALIVAKPQHFDQWFAVGCVLFTGVGLFCLNNVA